MSKETIIRRADERDVEALADLLVAFRDSLGKSKPSREQFKKSTATLLKDGGAVFGLAEEEGRPLGYFMLRQQPSVWASGREGVLEDLFVLPEARGKKLGTQLVEFALSCARQGLCKSVSLDTNERNEASNALYRHLGFKSERPRWNGGRQIRYDKDLD